MYYERPKKSRKSKKIRIIALFAAAALLLILIDLLVEYMIKDTAIAVSRMTASRIVNDAVIDVLESGEYEYSDFVIVDDENGMVKSVSAKSEYVNRFKSELGRSIINALDGKKEASIEIPLGTLTDIGVLYGRGPDVKVNLRLYGDVKTSLSSSFISVGINQTKHSISCKISANIEIITPSFKTYTSVDTSYLIAETVIVGEIPDSYTNVNGDDSGIIGQIFDYADIGE